jgi:hypothetical protein
MMKRTPTYLSYLTLLLAAAGASSAAEIYVSPDGKPGAADAPLADLAEATAAAKPGDVIRLKAGTFKVEKTLVLQNSGAEGKPIRVEPFDGERVVLDFSSQEFGSKNRGIEIKGDWWHFVGVQVWKAGDNGFNVSGHHNTLERCVASECRDSGFQIGAPASHTLIVGCDSFRNFDAPSHGENADGFCAKFEVGEGNVFRNCRAWENSDDGWDLWKAPHPILIEDCVAFRNGLNVWKQEGFTGNGNGFKLGGAYIAGAHVVRRCVAIDQPLRGFDQNNNTAGLTIEDSTAVRCGVGFHLPAAPKTGQHVLKNNLSESPIRVVEGTALERNRWLNDAPPPTKKVELSIP